MSELQKLVIVSVEDSEISTKLQVAKEDYSAMFDAVAYKQQFNKEAGEWEDSEEAMKKYNEALEVAGGLFEEDNTIELYVDEQTGKAYFTEGSGFIKIEKPLVSLKRIKKAPIVAIQDSPKGRSVVIEHKGKHYAFNFNTGVWVAKKEMFIPNMAKLGKAKARFNELFEDVGVEWETAEKAVGMVVDVTVNKNQLDPTSNVGWLEALPLDPEDQPEQKPVEEVYHSIDITADDLPF
ncbi:MAG: hypothetical protein ACLTE9_19005 [Thomasclavelia ramosa]